MHARRGRTIWYSIHVCSIDFSAKEHPTHRSNPTWPRVSSGRTVGYRSLVSDCTDMDAFMYTEGSAVQKQQDRSPVVDGQHWHGCIHVHLTLKDQYFCKNSRISISTNVHGIPRLSQQAQVQLQGKFFLHNTCTTGKGKKEEEENLYIGHVPLLLFCKNNCR